MRKKSWIGFVCVAALSVTGAGGALSARAEEERSLYRADTAVTLPPAVVQEIKTDKEYASLVSAVKNHTERPQIALFYPDAELNANGVAVSQIVEELQGGVLPAFYVRNEETAESFSSYAETSAMYDAYVVASDPRIVSAVKEKAGELYGVLDVRGNGQTLAETVAAVNGCGARTAWVGERSKRETEYLQYRSVNVWTDGSADAVLTGANGVVTDAVKNIYDFLESLPADALLRNPMMIGHRGMEMTKLENSLSGLRAAFAAGADAVECDFQVSKDNRLVVMHDEDLQRTTNGTGKIKEKNWDEIKEYLIDYPKAAKDKEPVPLLDDFFKEIKKNGKMLVVEIKSADERSVPLLKELVDEYEVADQIVLISYFSGQINRARSLMPEVAIGDLNYNPKSAPSFEAMVRDAARRGVTFVPAWTEVDSEIGYELFVRGFGVTCGTYRNAADLGNGYAYGWHSLIVSDSSWPSALVEGAEGGLKLYSDRAVEPEIKALTLAGESVKKEARIISADFGFVLSADGVTADRNGSYTATVQISFTGLGKSFCIFERVPVTVVSYSEENTGDPVAPDVPEYPNESDKQDGNETDKPSEEGRGETGGCNSAVSISAAAAGGALLLGAVGAIIFCMRGRKE